MRPKFEYVRSKALLEACRAIPCQHCGIDDGTVVAAHSNQSRHGKGRGIKSSDVYVSALCSICHHQIDQGFLFSRVEKAQMWDEAHQRTVELLCKRGLWPEWVPLP